MKIRIFVTGGTIDGINLRSKTPRKTYNRQMLAQARINNGIKPSVEILMKKDSREINDTDRALILKKCRDCAENQIIITHGTFTMPDTARYLGKKIHDKVIVITGSAIPFSRNKSDAMFNLGSAFTAVQSLSSGVYIIINGEIFQWNNVKKDLATGRFCRIKRRRGNV
ncbi:MAG: asparaginase domain-containing protein [Candidatus Micrarchaeota archaeon]